MNPSDELDLTDVSKHELEVIKLEVENFVQSKLYGIFQLTCQTAKLQLTDAVLETSLRGVEGLFTREAVMGEALGWKRMQTVFTELLESVTTEINKRK